MFFFRRKNDDTPSSSGEEPGNVEEAKTASTTIADVSSSEDLSKDLRADPEARAAFLATFTPEEEKAIMRKVDLRFLVLIGFMYLVKNAGSPVPWRRPSPPAC